VLSTDQMAEVPTGRYTDVVLTRDTNPLEPEVAELKFYARGRSGARGPDVRRSGREELLETTRAVD
jgi:hypothetical protein